MKKMTPRVAENEARIGFQSCEDGVLSHTSQGRVPREARQRCADLDAEKPRAGLHEAKVSLFLKK